MYSIHLHEESHPRRPRHAYYNPDTNPQTTLCKTTPAPNHTPFASSLAHTPPPPPPQRRVLLDRHPALRPGLPAHRPPPRLDIPPASAAAHHADLAEGGEQAAAGGDPHEDEELGAEAGHDVEVGRVGEDVPLEDEPHAGRDAGREKGHQAGGEGEERDRDGHQARVDGQRAQEDQHEGGEGRGEEHSEHGVRGGAEDGQVVGHVGGERDYIGFWLVEEFLGRERWGDWRWMGWGDGTLFPVEELVENDLHGVEPVHQRGPAAGRDANVVVALAEVPHAHLVKVV